MSMDFFKRYLNATDNVFLLKKGRRMSRKGPCTVSMDIERYLEFSHVFIMSLIVVKRYLERGELCAGSSFVVGLDNLVLTDHYVRWRSYSSNIICVRLCVLILFVLLRELMYI